MTYTNSDISGEPPSSEAEQATYEYDAQGRMQYHPALHENHKKAWLQPDEKFLIENYVILGPETVSLAPGRTIHVVMRRACILRKAGKMRKPELGIRKHERSRPNKPATASQLEAS